MIFSKIFSNKAKWQHKDSNIRILAIDSELHVASEQDRQILVDLARNDENDLVRRSALKKLNDIAEWEHARLNDSHQGVKAASSEQIIELLSDDSVQAMSQSQKATFIDNHLTVSMAEDLLAKVEDDALVIRLINKIDKPQKWPALLLEKKSLAVKEYLLGKIADENQLEKILKKAIAQDSQELAQLVKEKIAIIAIEKQRPAKLKKDAQMVLSKLLALKEQKDYELILEKRTALRDEWQWLSEEFECLSQQDVDIFNEKFTSINSQLDKAFAPIKEQHEQALISQKLAQDKQEALQFFSAHIEKTGQRISNAVFENEPLDQITFCRDLEEKISDVNGSVLSEQDKKSLVKQYQALIHKAEQLNDIAEAVTQATHLISKMSQQSPPENNDQFAEKVTFFDEWKSDWRAIESKIDGLIPQSIIEAKQQITKQWQDAIKPLVKEQNQLFHQAQVKASELKRLIAQGKYNASFGVFKRFERLFLKLSEKHQSRLQRDFDQLSEKMLELSDWEHYIATPRKQELLEQIQSLAINPLDNPIEQANKVKQYRKTWNSLGHADEEVDQSFNDSFNQACEQAFAPCRQFYAEQEKLREVNFEARTQLVGEAKSLSLKVSDNQIDEQHIETHLNRLLKSWREAGEIDRERYKGLNHDFQEAMKPVKAFITSQHQKNASRKKQLIEQVELLAKEEDIYSAVNQVKQLQAQWKSAGYAGSKLENKLWAEFRKVNDVIFDARDALKNEQAEQVNQRVDAQLEILSDIEGQLVADNEVVTLKSYKKQLAEMKTNELAQKPTAKKVLAKIEQLIGAIDKQLTSFAQQEKTRSWKSMFELLSLLIKQQMTFEAIESNEHFKSLSNKHQKLFVDALHSPIKGDRAHKTIELEVLAGVESPEQDQNSRMSIQVALMQEKMTSGQTIELEASFFDWIKLGTFSKADEQLLKRVEAIFLKMT